MATEDGGDATLTEARSRVAGVIARFEHIDPEALSLVALPAPDAARRAALRAKVTRPRRERPGWPSSMRRRPRRGSSSSGGSARAASVPSPSA